MGTANITIEVDEAAARAFAEASPGEQQKLQLLLSVRLQELTAKPGETLQSAMDETGMAAESRGLTPEILRISCVTSNVRAVVDTNVTGSAALLPRSTPRRALDQVLEQGTLLISLATLAELNEVLRRPRFNSYLRVDERLEFLAALVRESELVEVTTVVSACRDPKDDKFLELALSGAATHIISGDDDLLGAASVSRHRHPIFALFRGRKDRRGVATIRRQHAYSLFGYVGSMCVRQRERCRRFFGGLALDRLERRWAIWSGVRTSMWGKMDHWSPWGAVMRVRRSP